MFDRILDEAKQSPMKVAVVAAHDLEVLEAVTEAKRQGVAVPILIGDHKKIIMMAEQIKVDIVGIKIIDEPDNMKAAFCANEMIRNGEADFLMKGFLQTAELLKAILDKERGLRTGNMLSHVAILESEHYDKLLFLTDCGMVMYPDLKQKVGLINNAVQMAKALGVDVPKVAVLAAVEIVNPDMPATMDAAVLSQMNRRGQIKDCIVDGPLAFDNAISMEAAKHKGVLGSDVAGNADIILVPNIETGNALYKSATRLSACKIAGVVVGAKVPIVLTSRADTAESKLYAIACASRLSSYLKHE